MDVTTATPVEIDTALAALYRREQEAERDLAAAYVRAHHALGERARYVSRTRKAWPSSDREAMDRCRQIADPDAYRYDPAGAADDAVRRHDAAEAALSVIGAEAAPKHAEYRRRPWSRFFTVQQHDGHIHASMDCPTCNKGHEPTRFGWNPELSGLSEADAVAKLGPTLCTVCFPSAPVAWTLGAPDTSCAGSRRVPKPGTTRRVGPREYGTCAECGDTNILLTQAGAVRKHQHQPAKTPTG